MASPREREETLKGLTDAVTRFDEEKVAELGGRALELGIEAGDAILQRLDPRHGEGRAVVRATGVFCA